MARLPNPPPSQFPPTPPNRPPINVIKLLAHSPSTVAHWTGVGTAHYRSLLLPKRLREITILYCSARFGSSYEWDHHVFVSAEVVSEAERAAIKSAAESGRGYFGRGERENFGEREMVLLRFLEEVTAGPTVGDELWGEMRRAFCEREIVEILSLQGFYYMISRLGTVLQVDMDEFALERARTKAKL